MLRPETRRTDEEAVRLRNCVPSMSATVPSWVRTASAVGWAKIVRIVAAAISAASLLITLNTLRRKALRRHRAQQDKDRKEWENAWVETGRVFTKENGEMLHPANVTRRFIELYEEIGLPPVRLHDLRHGAATLAHAAGADLKDIQEMLGHSSITITADTYTSLLPEADLAIAEAAARLVPRARAASENTASAAKPEPDEAEKPDPESVPDDADPLGDIREINSPSAHAPLTQTAPDEESEAE